MSTRYKSASLLCLVTIAAAIVCFLPRGWAESTPPPPPPRTLHAAFWSTGGAGDTVVLVNNPVPRPIDLTLTVYQASGSVLLEHPFQIEESGSVSVSLKQLLGNRGGEGRLDLTLPGDIEMIAAQALVSDGVNGWVADFEDPRNLSNRSPRQLATLPGLEVLGQRGSGMQSYCVLTNAGPRSIDGTVSVPGDRQNWSKRWNLKPGQTRVVHLNEGRVRQSLGRLTVELDQPDGGFLLAGYSRLRDGSVLPIHFQDAEFSSSGELAAFYSGPGDSLLLWNFSPEPLQAQVTALDDHGDVRSSTLGLGPDESRRFALNELFGTLSSQRGVVRLTVPEGAKLTGETLHLGAAVESAALRDSLTETNVAYSFAVRLDDDFSSQIEVFNPNDEEVEMCVFLYFGDFRYTYPLKKLGPGQYAHVDLLQARQDGLPGEGGPPIPTDAAVGQAKVIMHNDNVRKNLVVLGRYADLGTGRTVAFQGCFGCPPTLAFVEIQPSSIDGLAGEDKTFTVIATFDDWSFKDVTLSASTHSDTDNHFVATTFGRTVHLVNAGLAFLTSTFNGCAEYGSELGGHGRLQCICNAPAPYSDTVPVQSDPPTITINGPSSILVGEPEVALSLTMNPSGGTVSNYRVEPQSSATCLGFSPSGGLIGRAPGTVGVQVDYTINSTTVSSPVFNVTIAKTTQYVNLIYSSAADTILATHFNATEVSSIKSRVLSQLQSRFSGAKVTFGPPVAPVTRVTNLTFQGNSPGTQGGEASFDLVNFTRFNDGTVYLGTGSLDLANSADPVPGGINERTSQDRVGDAIARLAAHEIGHMFGLVPQSSELTGTGIHAQLAAKLMLNTLGLNGTGTHHNSNTNNIDIMEASVNITQTRAWNAVEYSFESRERDYLARVLPQ